MLTAGGLPSPRTSSTRPRWGSRRTVHSRPSSTSCSAGRQLQHRCRPHRRRPRDQQRPVRQRLGKVDPEPPVPDQVQRCARATGGSRWPRRPPRTGHPARRRGQQPGPAGPAGPAAAAAARTARPAPPARAAATGPPPRTATRTPAPPRPRRRTTPRPSPRSAAPGRTSSSQVPDRVTARKSGVCSLLSPRRVEPQPERLRHHVAQLPGEVQRQQHPASSMLSNPCSRPVLTMNCSPGRCRCARRQENQRTGPPCPAGTRAQLPHRARDLVPVDPPCHQPAIRPAFLQVQTRRVRRRHRDQQVVPARQV